MLKPVTVLRVCRQRVNRGVRVWGTRTHLIYFAAVGVSEHSWAGAPALICLCLGVAAELTGGEHVGPLA